LTALRRILTCFIAVLLAAAMLAGCSFDNSSAAGYNASRENDSSSAVSYNDSGENDNSPGVSYNDSGENDNTPGVVTDTDDQAGKTKTVDVNGTYTSKEDVALYIHTYGSLPSNYVTKKQAQAAGWDSSRGDLDEVLPGKSIGGDRFGNYEGLLPKSASRRYYECDIDYEGGYRNAKRIIYSNDGLVYYTQDHYKTFEQLY